MTQKQTILGRISQLARANVNALLDRAEDPEKMLDQLIRDYTNSIAEAEEAVAQTIANVRMAESDLQADREAAGEWGRKAAAASAKVARLTPSWSACQAANGGFPMASGSVRASVDAGSRVPTTTSWPRASRRPAIA